MFGAIVLSTFMILFEPIELPRNVYVYDARIVRIPIEMNPAAQKHIDEIRLFVSTDQGKTWKLVMASGSDVRQMTFTAPRDGLYWLAMQTVDLRGNRVPRMPEVGLKVFVNSAGRKIVQRP